MTGIARQTEEQQTHYIRATVNYNDAGIGSGVVIGTLPKGAVIVGTTVYCKTAFNAGTTNALQVGTAASGTQVTNDAATAGARNTVPALDLSAGDQDIFATYAQTGTAATAGQATIVIQYAPNNDK